jgi:hypothetical protein
VLSGRELIIRPDKSYRLWCVVVFDLENLVTEKAMTHLGAVVPKTNKQKYCIYSNEHEAYIDLC